MNSKLLSKNKSVEYEYLNLSIVIPTYKRARYLTDSINSVLNQNYSGNLKYEIIVVNNDPSDDMKEVIEIYKGKLISFYRNEENYGQVGNINQCALLASGKYICYLHDDDVLMPNYLTSVERYILEELYDCILPEYYDFYEEYVFEWKHHLLRCLSFFNFFSKDKIQKIDPEDYKKCFHDIYDAPTCGVLFKKKAIEEFGLFKDIAGAAWDYYNFRKFNEKYDVYFLHSCIGGRRRYTGMSNTEKVKSDFTSDSKQLLEELSETPFIKRYHDCIFSGKPIHKYMMYRFRQDAYIYLHNLERRRPVSRRTFNRFISQYIHK